MLNNGVVLSTFEREGVSYEIIRAYAATMKNSIYGDFSTYFPTREACEEHIVESIYDLTPPFLFTYEITGPHYLVNEVRDENLDET